MDTSFALPNPTNTEADPMYHQISFAPDPQVNSTTPSAYYNSSPVREAYPHLSPYPVSFSIAPPSIGTNSLSIAFHISRAVSLRTIGNNVP